ncbi:hypothetical protein Nisw_03095 [Candidatus Nitrosopumilus sp. SW]|uniref:hypothetical protein n=1 Tax=Candidatus Nitrosopumilus sp. SW TaxID=2508726 RepID=UPI00114E774A|nr:hypothetical protein [Candidatus Nitrosopumilus sp. SW]QDI88590.1 hypothetical protein Nisw_03095 [Candidatus Nitrosopumilus sp. SW]
MRPLIPLSVVVVVAIIIGIMGSSNYDLYVAERNQRNLQLAVDDCKKLFQQGIEQEECITKSLDVFGTDYQKEQWSQRDLYSINP